ncbi:MAG: hypothetical protein ACOC9W_02170 [Persicimonas sp.]
MRQISFRMLLTGLLAGLLVALSGCATEPEREQRDLRKAQTDEQAPKVERPPPEELAKSPCGNPDWAQLPPGAQAKPPEDEAEDQGTPDESEETEESEEIDKNPDAPAEEAEEDGRRSDAHINPDRQQPCS